jgi:D-sedoheptulose 7-phosphate isomerase
MQFGQTNMTNLNLDDYFKEYKECLIPENLFSDLSKAKDIIESANRENGKIIFAGNGASSSISSHAALDFTKQANIKATSYHDPALITAFVNDYGYDNWLREVFVKYTQKNDIGILISVSGESRNIINAAKFLKENGNKVISFSGKSINNELRSISDLSFWVDSQSYNIVEGIHMIWVTTIIDMIIGKSVYSVS